MNLWIPDPEAPILHTVRWSTPLRPHGWQRPSKPPGVPVPVKPKADREWQAAFLEYFEQEMIRQKLLALFPWSGPLILETWHLYPKPKSWLPGKMKTTDPDADNLLKSVCDALGGGKEGNNNRLVVAYLDDNQVIAKSTWKGFHDSGPAVITQMRLLASAEWAVANERARKASEKEKAPGR